MLDVIYVKKKENASSKIKIKKELKIQGATSKLALLIILLPRLILYNYIPNANAKKNVLFYLCSHMAVEGICKILERQNVETTGLVPVETIGAILKVLHLFFVPFFNERRQKHIKKQCFNPV